MFRNSNGCALAWDKLAPILHTQETDGQQAQTRKDQQSDEQGSLVFQSHREMTSGRA